MKSQKAFLQRIKPQQVITPDPDLEVEIISLELQAAALSHVRDRDYKSLAKLLDFQPQLAAEKGQRIVDAMYHVSYLDDQVDNQDFIYGHQLTGYQLQVLAYVKKAGAPIEKGDSTVHFDYVAQIKQEGRGYVAQFPDLQGLSAHGKDFKAVQTNAAVILAGYISNLMLNGKSLPAPKYHEHKTKAIRPFKVQLTLADLVFENTTKATDFTTVFDLRDIFQ